jgi:hypothetical protein
LASFIAVNSGYRERGSDEVTRSACGDGAAVSVIAAVRPLSGPASVRRAESSNP